MAKAGDLERKTQEGAEASKGPLYSLVSNYIRESIETQRLKPGDLIDFVEIGSALGISRTPIRESIGLFQLEGLLESFPGGQYRVAALSEHKAEAYYLVRHEVEVEATKLIVAQITSYEIGLLWGNVELFKEHRGSPQQLIRIDKQYHEILYDATRNRYLTQQLKHLRSVLGLMPVKSFDQIRRVDDSIEEHVAIVTALEKHDCEAAVAAVSRHVQNARKARTGVL